MKKIVTHSITLSVLSAVLLSLSWPERGITPLIFIAFIPLLLVHDKLSNEKRKYLKVFSYSYLTFIIWNVLTTFWVWFASPGGSIMAMTANALLMTITFTAAKFFSDKLPKYMKPIIYSACYISFEYFHLDWDLTWTWLTLGNVFSEYYKWIQWYEYTGVFGGSLWILFVNFAFYYALYAYKKNKKTGWVFSVTGILLIVIPIFFSFLLLKQTFKYDSNYNVVVVQPNIDPYGEKFSGNFPEQHEKMFDLAKSKTDSATDLLVFPETAIIEDLWENDMSQTYSVNRINKFLENYPKLSIVIGAATWKAYEENETPSSTARKFKRQEGYYDAFNTAFYFNKNEPVQIYHKSKLVPGVEKMPFPALFKYLENIAIDMGGTSGSLGSQSERSVFRTNKNKLKPAPVICYESVYGEFVGAYIRKGANLITIITNDGWWGDTPGYRQHKSYARLRAIETRKFVARSANTGISCFIDPFGNSFKDTEWWKEAVIDFSIPVREQNTFYTMHGDYIARAMCLLLLGIFMWVVYTIFRTGNSSRQRKQS